MALIWPIPGTKEDWKLRSDVLFHFFAYQYFSHLFNKNAGIDLVNLTDGDVQFYNRTYDNIKCLQSYGKLARYLNKFPTTHPSLTTLTSNSVTKHRAHLIAHVRAYNMTTTPRRRFYMLNLSPSELASLQLNSAQVTFGIATGGITENTGKMADEEANRDEEFVAEKLLDYMKVAWMESNNDKCAERIEGEEVGEEREVHV